MDVPEILMEYISTLQDSDMALLSSIDQMYAIYAHIIVQSAAPCSPTAKLWVGQRCSMKANKLN